MCDKACVYTICELVLKHKYNSIVTLSLSYIKEMRKELYFFHGLSHVWSYELTEAAFH